MKLVVDEAAQDVRYALRQLRRNPAFAAAAMLTLAIGIGANSAVFSVVNGVLLEPLPYGDPDDLVAVHTAFPTLGFDEFWMSPPEFYELREQNEVFDDMGAWRVGSGTIETLDRPVRVPGAVATWSFFTTLGVEAALGRTFLESEDRIGAEPVVLISHGLWERGFAADPAVVGRAVRVSGEAATIVGVLPEGFDIEDAGVDVWWPLNRLTEVDPAARTIRWGNHYMNVVARVSEGVTPDRVAEDLARIGQRASETYGTEVHTFGSDTHPVFTTDLRTELLGDVRPTLLLLMGAVTFVLLIACANVANLLLARAQGRGGEVAVRVAMGAGRGRLVRQFLTEGLALALVGGALGLVLAAGGTRLLLGVNPDAVPRLGEVGLDGRVIAFTAVVAIATGLAFGLAPLLGTGSARVGATLKEGGTRATRGPAGALARRALVTAEVALAVVLLVGAGLMLRSVAALRDVDLGFDTENVLSFRVSLPEADYPDPPSVGDFYARLLERVRAQPGVVAASATTNLPPFHTLSANDTELEGVPQTLDGPPHNVDYYTRIEEGYLDAMGIGVVEGRGFEPADALSETPVMLVSERLARTFYPDQSPLGRIIGPGGVGARFTIVGVVEDVTQSGVGAPAGTELYFYGPQVAQIGLEAGREKSVVIRTERDPLALAPVVERLTRELDPALAIADLETLEQRVDRALAQPRFLTLLLAVFAAVALLLAAGGTYGVMANSVAERSREIAIRMAMGAQPASVRTLVLGEGAVLAATGLALGLAGAFALSRLLAAQLYEVGATDPATFAAVPLFLAGVALVATWIPARRATRIDPVEALREA